VTSTLRIFVEASIEQSIDGSQNLLLLVHGRVVGSEIQQELTKFHLFSDLFRELRIEIEGIGVAEFPQSGV